MKYSKHTRLPRGVPTYSYRDLQHALQEVAEAGRACRLDYRALRVAAYIVEGARREPPVIEPERAVTIAQRWATIVDAVKPGRRQLQDFFYARCPRCRQRDAFYRSPCLGNDYEGEVACLRSCSKLDLDDLVRELRAGGAA